MNNLSRGCVCACVWACFVCVCMCLRVCVSACVWVWLVDMVGGYGGWVSWVGGLLVPSQDGEDDERAMYNE